MTFGQVRLATVLLLVARHEGLRTRSVAEGEFPACGPIPLRQLGERSIAIDVRNGARRPAACRVAGTGAVLAHGPDE